MERRDLYVEFANGFWIVANTINNPSSTTLRTDKSQLKLRNYDISHIYLFKQIRLFRRLISTQRVSLNVKTLMDNINRGKWELEFLYEYHAYHGVLFCCCLWTKDIPYSIECQLILDCDDMQCYWNQLCEDKPW